MRQNSFSWIATVTVSLLTSVKSAAGLPQLSRHGGRLVLSQDETERSGQHQTPAKSPTNFYKRSSQDAAEPAIVSKRRWVMLLERVAAGLPAYGPVGENNQKILEPHRRARKW